MLRPRDPAPADGQLIAREATRPVKLPLLLRAALEGLAVFTMVFLGCGSIALLWLRPGLYPVPVISLVFAAVVVVAFHLLLPRTQAHLNPAVSVAVALSGWFPWHDALAYVSAQCAGGVLAALALKRVFPQATHFGATVPRGSSFAELLREVLLAFLLILAAGPLATKASPRWRSLAIGGLVVGLGAYGGWLGGAVSMNPARSLGVNGLEGRLDVMWIYALGPFLGVTLGCRVLKRIAIQAR